MSPLTREQPGVAREPLALSRFPFFVQERMANLGEGERNRAVSWKVLLRGGSAQV